MSPEDVQKYIRVCLYTWRETQGEAFYSGVHTVCTVCPRKVYREECDGKGGECVTLFEYSCRRGSPSARSVGVWDFGTSLKEKVVMLVQ